MNTIMCVMLPMLEDRCSLFPFNPSLEDEIKRLFDLTHNRRPQLNVPISDHDDDNDDSRRISRSVNTSSHLARQTAVRVYKSRHIELHSLLRALLRTTHDCDFEATERIRLEEVMEEFRHNGRDFEYCPDLDTDMGKQITPRRKKNKKPLPTECVFCRNNGEEATYYREHLLKDVDGRVSCPVLRAYTCPICGACGDDAHTVKYCPKGPYNSNSYTTPSSTGKRRNK